jgi:hypothetical protein
MKMIPILLALLAGAATEASTRRYEDPRDEAVLRAIVRDTLRPAAATVAEKGSPNRLIVIANQTLGVCPKVVVGPCISNEVLAIVRRQAAMGRWAFEFSRLISQKNQRPARLSPFTMDGVTNDPTALATIRPRPYPFAVSSPVYAGDEALVYVQFANTWSWLVLVARDGATWKVKFQEPVGIS